MPDRVGRYELLLPIASGGMGRVFLARNAGAGGFTREFALKLTHAHLSSEEDFANDLLQEAKIAGQIRHHNVVQVVDVGHDPLGVFLVMDYVEGETLGGLLRRARQPSQPPVPDAIAVRILLDALAGLHVAHELTDDAGALLGIVHRDFSPHNILVGVDGVARLTDFGIAKATSRLDHTRAGLVKGKLAYMAPEQARAQPLDRRCDVWAAGVVAWEAFGRRRLFEIEDVSTLLTIVSEPPPLLSTVRRDLPAEIDATIAWALTIPREHRCPTAAELAKRLGAAATATTGVATHEEVGAYVRSIAGPKLDDRRKKVTELVGLRARMGELGKIETSGEPSSPVVRPVELASAAPGSAASTDSTEAAPAASAAPTPSAEPSSPAAAVAVGALSPSGFPEAETVSVATPSAMRVVPEPRPRRAAAPAWRHPAVLAAGTGAVVATVLVLIVWAAAPNAGSSAQASSAALAGTGPSPSPIASAPSAAPPTANAASPEASAPVAATEVRVAANASITGLSVDGRWVPVSPPARDVRLELTPKESAHKAVVQAISADQRRATTVLQPGATRAVLTFTDAGSKGGKLMRWE